MFTPEQARGLAAFLIRCLEEEAPITRKVLAAVPDACLDFKLGEKGRTARELMWHIILSEGWFAEGIAAQRFGEEPKAPAPAAVREMAARYDRDFAAAIAKMKAVPAERLARPIDFFGMFNLPAVAYLQFWLTHSIHHRGQLSSYLRAMNARVPAMYGSSADEECAAPASMAST